MPRQPVVRWQTCSVVDLSSFDAQSARDVSLWTGCYTPRELRLLLAATGFGTPVIFGVEPGAYRAAPPSLDLPEFLVTAERL